MSNFTSNYTFSEQSYSSSTDSSGNTYTSASMTDPSGTVIQETTKQAGQPAYTETTTYPSGREGVGRVEGAIDGRGRIEDVTDKDNDKAYEERIEDEYAKREGGA